MSKILQNEIPSYKKISSFANLFSAWREFQKRKQKKEDVSKFAENLIHNLSVLESDLLSGSYSHGEYVYFRISDPKQRDIHKALVRDRVVHHAIYRALYPYFDTKFIYDSYSCRINKGTHKAINQFRKYACKVSKNNTKTCWVLKCDIKKFFANIDHEILKKILEKYIEDENIIWLFSQVIDSFSARQDLAEVGLPLGNLTSQILVNIYMNDFDQFMKRELKVKYYIRYADDFVILHEDKKYLENLLPNISDFLKKELKLQLHPYKVFIKTLASGVDFLGWVHFPYHRVLRTKTKKRAIKVFRHNPSKFAQASYLGLFKHGNTNKLVSFLTKNAVWHILSLPNY